MAQMSAQGLEVLDKALALSTQDRGVLIHQLIESLDEEPAEEGVEAAWDEEIKRRVDDVRLGRVKTIPGEQVMKELRARRRNTAR
jgi:putative addiction module component (TIGR02574 family)